MREDDFSFWKARLDEQASGMLNPSRLAHSRRCAEYAGFLAEKFGADVFLCTLAGLGHDISREQSPGIIRDWARRDLKSLPDFMIKNPVLHHGPASAWYVGRKLGLKEPSLLNAIRYHTTGHPGLDANGLVVYAADYMEPGRTHISNKQRKNLLALPLEKLVMEILTLVNSYLLGRKLTPAPWSRELYEELKKR